MSAIAFLFMLWHHLFANGTWYLPDTSLIYLFGYKASLYNLTFAGFGNICIYMFSMMSGYALAVNSNGFSNAIKCGKRLWKFLTGYWLTIVVFSIAGLICGDKLPSAENLLWNMFGFKTGEDWIRVPFAWYVSYYCLFMVIAPILVWIFNRKVDWKVGFAIWLLMMVAIPVLLLSQKDNWLFWPLYAAFTGVIAGKYDIFGKCHKYVTSKLHWSILLLCLPPLIYFRQHDAEFARRICGVIGVTIGDGQILDYFTSRYVDVAVAFLMILGFTEFLRRCKNAYVHKALMFLGGLSMYMWFLHGLPFVGHKYMQYVIYAPKHPILIFILSVVVFAAMAYACDVTMNFIRRKCNEIIEALQSRNNALIED